MMISEAEIEAALDAYLGSKLWRTSAGVPGYRDAARNIHQARALAVESPKRTLRSVGKRKQQVGAIHACV
jgi:hypothetical protein